MLNEIKKYAETIQKDAIPQLSINCVIVGFHNKTLKVVVNKFMTGESTLLVLPGGYINQKEDVLDAVERIVKESTGMENMLFRQFAVFGKASRSFAKEMDLKPALKSGLEQNQMDWISKRFVSLCYIALVEYKTIDFKPTDYIDSVKWLPMDQTWLLAMDHGDIVLSAREFLLKEMPYSPIASNLLPAQFTLPELLALMEAILCRNIDRPNFRRKILSMDILEKVGLDNSGKSRPADLYKFKHGKNTSLIDDFKFGF